MEYFGYILLSVVILLVMVTIHELGHYVAAKILGFTVNEFSIGFGPKIFGKKLKNGETFSLRAIPLGGYCAFLGEDDDDDAPPPQSDADKPTGETADKQESNNGDAACNAESGKNTESHGKDDDLLSFVMRTEIKDDAKKCDAAPKKEVRLDKNGNPVLTFNQQKPWKRIIVLLGGITFNLLSAIIFSFIFIWSVGYAVPVVGEVYAAPDGTPYCALQSGDVIRAVDGKKITILDTYADLVAGYKLGDTVTVEVDRGGEIISVELERKNIVYTNEEGKTTEYVGFGMLTTNEFTGKTAGNAFLYCVPYTFKLAWSILGSFGGLITGRIPITAMSGPIGSIKMMADVSIANWRNILLLLPLIASNLAMFNLLPIPALDGCKVIFTLIEWIRKKPINRKVEGIINFVGLIVIMLFVVIVDILSFAL